MSLIRQSGETRQPDHCRAQFRGANAKNLTYQTPPQPRLKSTMCFDQGDKAAQEFRIVPGFMPLPPPPREVMSAPAPHPQLLGPW